MSLLGAISCPLLVSSKFLYQVFKMIIIKNKERSINIRKFHYPKNITKKQNLKSILNFFCENTSIHGCNRISSRKISTLERTFWIVLLLLTIVVSGVLIDYLWSDYISYPILITEDTKKIPLSDFTYPGVSICSVNKISKERAHAFAEKLYKQYDVRQAYPKLSDLLQSIKLLSNLYDFNSSNKSEESKLQDILEKFDHLTKNFDPSDRIVDLAPTCNEILLNCSLAGVNFDCLDLFLTRSTHDGLCCVFNNVRAVSRAPMFHKFNYGKKVPTKPMQPKGLDVKNGLQVVLKNNLDDYFVTTAEINGYRISIFNPEDFADKSSGSLAEILAEFATELFIKIDLIRVMSTKSIKIFPENMRGCVFSDERRTDFGTYRHSDCLAECKVHAIMDLCQCVPFFLPLDAVNYCTLTDLPCLDKFRKKWISYYPTEEDAADLNFEKQESISCSCLPTCDDYVYAITSDVLPVFAHSTNNTYVNIFFGRNSGAAYMRDLNQTWFELVSSFGGFVSIFLGLSFISVAEIIVLFYKLAMYYYKIQYPRLN